MNKKLVMFAASAVLLSACAHNRHQAEDPARCDIQFDTNSDAIRASETAKVANYAKRMVNEPLLRYQLRGHADERNSSDYNKDLALRRSWSVERALIANGAGDNQFDLETYGKDSPLVKGSGEKAWQLNRCVNLVEEFDTRRDYGK